jgi:hypothetical protein
MNEDQILMKVSRELGVVLNEKSFSFNKQILAERINELVNTDFQKLISILYRVDVSESKLKQLLKDNPGTNAGLIIAELMIERQREKIKSRQQYGKRDENISDDEKW